MTPRHGQAYVLRKKSGKFSKKNSFQRRVDSFFRHFFLMAQPFSFALVAAYIWDNGIYKNGIHLSKEDEGPILTGVFLLLSVTYGVITATMFSSVWDKYKSVVEAVLKKDKDTFMLYRDERLPIIVHLLILSFSIPLLSFCLFVEYKDILSGYCSVFSSSFVLSLYFVVIAELQNPSKAPWLAERIPHDWLHDDVDKHFWLDLEAFPVTLKEKNAAGRTL